jgi:hypothetical protein
VVEKFDAKQDFILLNPDSGGIIPSMSKYITPKPSHRTQIGNGSKLSTVDGRKWEGRRFKEVLAALLAAEHAATLEDVPEPRRSMLCEFAECSVFREMFFAAALTDPNTQMIQAACADRLVRLAEWLSNDRKQSETREATATRSRSPAVELE